MALALAVLLLLLQAMPLVHSVFQQFDPMLGDVCIAAPAADGSPAPAGEHGSDCDDCCCAGPAPIAGRAANASRWPSATRLALASDERHLLPSGSEFDRPWSRAPPAAR
ncbi:MAG: hypothetical protein KDG52_12170 [Rhodocyclaceae bacterium]|nr:hypothetical protein [Rhodocyclaceae bacterium]